MKDYTPEQLRKAREFIRDYGILPVDELATRLSVLLAETAEEARDSQRKYEQLHHVLADEYPKHKGFQPGMTIGLGHHRRDVHTLVKLGYEHGLDDGSENWVCEDGNPYWFYPDDLDRVVSSDAKALEGAEEKPQNYKAVYSPEVEADLDNYTSDPIPAKPTTFTAGMKIAPGHGRIGDEILRFPMTALQSTGTQAWSCESGKSYVFYPDDLQRVIPSYAKATGGGPSEQPREIWNCAHCDFVSDPYDTEAVRKHALSHMGDTPPQWKPGQRIRSKDRLTVYEMGKQIRRDWWSYKTWIDGQGWGVLIDDGYFPPEYYEPWPRLGDWVRCNNNKAVHTHLGDRASRVFQITKITDRAHGMDGQYCPIEDLEPVAAPSDAGQAAAPEGKGEQRDDHRFNSKDFAEAGLDSGLLGFVIEADGSVKTNQPRPKLEGPHWDSPVHCSQIDGCSRDHDLREAVRDHEKRIKDLEGKRG